LIASKELIERFNAMLAGGSPSWFRRAWVALRRILVQPLAALRRFIPRIPFRGPEQIAVDHRLQNQMSLLMLAEKLGVTYQQVTAPLARGQSVPRPSVVNRADGGDRRRCVNDPAANRHFSDARRVRVRSGRP
jgi:hypothetical protein